MRKTRKPARTFITFAHSVLDESGTGVMTYRLPWPEAGPVADGLKEHGPIADVRAIDIGVREPLIPLQFPRERRWLVTLLALAEGDAMFVAMDEAQEKLREDLYAGRVLPGAHPGRPAVTDGPLAPLEAALRAFREETTAGLEREEQKRQARRPSATASLRQRWWRRLTT